jgi:ACR3 family arsenite efflux pump ArsB
MLFWQALTLVNKNLTIAIPISLLAGFITGSIINGQILSFFVMPLTFLIVYPMMITLKYKTLLSSGDLKVQFLTQIINFAFIPLLAYLVGCFFFPDNPFMQLGVVLAGLVPTSGMTISWTGFARGNVESAVKMTVIGLTLGSLATPVYIKLLFGTAITVDFPAIAKQIFLIVFLPMITGYITQQVLLKKYGQQKFQKDWAPKFPPLSSLGVLGIVFIAMAMKAPIIAASPRLLLAILLPLFILYLCNFLLSSYVGKWLLIREQAIALVFGSVMRNLSIALALAMNIFGESGSEAALVIAIAYIIQVQSAALYVKFINKIFTPS